MNLLIILLTIIGMVSATMIEQPHHTAVKVDEDARLNCTISTKDPHLLNWQANTMVDTSYKQIFYSPQGALVEWVEAIPEKTYDMTVRGVTYDRAGAYKCDYMTAQIFSGEAELMAMGELNCGQERQSHLEGSNVPFVCSVQLTGNLDPTMDWYIGDRHMSGGRYLEQTLGEDEEEPAPNAPRTFQFFGNYTVDYKNDGQAFTCKLHFSEGTEANPEPPTYKDQCQTVVEVKYAATNVEFQPDPANWDLGVMQMKVGETIKCIASGNPQPIISWNKIEEWDNEKMQVPKFQGEDLVITEDMTGDNHYNCSAFNEPQGQPRYKHRAVKFHVEGFAKEAESVGGGGSLIQSSTLFIITIAAINLLSLVLHRH